MFDICPVLKCRWFVTMPSWRRVSVVLWREMTGTPAAHTPRLCWLARITAASTHAIPGFGHWRISAVARRSPRCIVDASADSGRPSSQLSRLDNDV